MIPAISAIGGTIQNLFVTRDPRIWIRRNVAMPTINGALLGVTDTQ